MTIKEIKEKGLLLFECVSGSKAYGLDTPTSDTDIKGVFYLPKEQFFGLDYVAQVQNETNDEVYYELGRFVELLVKSNPGVLESLATPPERVLYKHPVMDKLPLEMFLSKQAKDTFAGYAVTQIYKARGLKKKIVNPFPKERKEVTDFCFVLQDCNTVPLQEWLLENDLEPKRCGLVKLPHSKGIYAVYYDNSGVKGYRGIQKNKEANEVCLSSIPKGENTVAYMSFNVESYSSYCKDYAAYWDWVAKRNEERYTVNQKHQGGYDSKNMMHTIRLLQVADEILLTGKLNVKRDNRDELLAIKAGEKKYEELLEMADRLIANIEKEDKKSSLRMFPDAVKAKEVLVTIREQLYNE